MPPIAVSKVICDAQSGLSINAKPITVDGGADDITVFVYYAAESASVKSSSLQYNPPQSFMVL